MADLHTAAIRLFRSLSMTSFIAPASPDHQPKTHFASADSIAPELVRRSSSSSVSSNSSTSSTDTELQPWKYVSRRKGKGEQDEVLRKRRELRQRKADAVWREFWG